MQRIKTDQDGLKQVLADVKGFACRFHERAAPYRKINPLSQFFVAILCANLL
jgi:hypothetical protein